MVSCLPWLLLEKKNKNDTSSRILQIPVKKIKVLRLEKHFQPVLIKKKHKKDLKYLDNTINDHKKPKKPHKNLKSPLK